MTDYDVILTLGVSSRPDEPSVERAGDMPRNDE
jgi:hypothetical protein